VLNTPHPVNSPLLLQSSWPTLHPVVLSLLTAGLTFLATLYWKRYDAQQAREKAESQALTDLKQKQQSDILKMEGTIAMVVSTIERLTTTAEQVTTITERVAGNSERIKETNAELTKLRDTITPQLADLKATVAHLRDVV